MDKQWTAHCAGGVGGRRVSSDERLVTVPVKAAWFGGLGPATILTRHYRTPAPLVIDGRCFVIGTDHVNAFNIYNGRLLWQRHFPDAARWPVNYRCAGAAVDHDRLFLLRDRECLALDPESGETLERFPLPDFALESVPESEREESIWEYLAVSGDLLIGAVGQPNRKVEWYAKAYPVNYCLFALDKQTGQRRWLFEAEEGVDSNAISIDDNVLCLIDGRPRYPFLFIDRNQEARQAPRSLIGLDLSSGRELWRQGNLHPTQNCLWMDDGVVVASQVPVSRTLQDARAEKAGGGLSAFDTRTGEPLWRVEKIKNLVPMIIEGVFYAPDAYDLRTGRPIANPGGQGQYGPRINTCCSTQAGCPTLIVARYSAMGFYDLANKTGSFSYSVARASCWINMIPAGGMVVAPEGSSSCQCAYNYKTSFGFISDDRHFNYALKGGGRNTERAMRVNFGAPGFHSDSGGGIGAHGLHRSRWAARWEASHIRLDPCRLL